MEHSQPIMMDRLFLTPTELARRWRMTTDHLYRAVLGRDLPAVRIGNGPKSRWRIYLADVKQYESTHLVTYHGDVA
jgi:excisionase family DNA binding protein